MAIPCYLAMTAAEIREKSVLPPNLAWMACHFSPYGLGLSNLPRSLPPGSLLILDDITPIHRHDPKIILEQLSHCAEHLHCSGILLDFQRPGVEETADLTRFLTASLPCPVAVSHFYGDCCTCAVCLPPVPPSEPPEAHFSPWQGRELWLELALDAVEVTVTEEGTVFQSLPAAPAEAPEFFEEALLCRYHCEVQEEAVKFTLRRAAEDLEQLLREAETFGVTRAVGLYQELNRQRLPCVKGAD